MIIPLLLRRGASAPRRSNLRLSQRKHFIEWAAKYEITLPLRGCNDEFLEEYNENYLLVPRQ
jgi:hypothetical protein